MISLASERLVTVEGREEGKVGWNVYWVFMLHSGVGFFVSSVSFIALGTFFFIAAEWWLALWASKDAEEQKELHWVWGLIGFSSATIFVFVIGAFSLYALLVIGSTGIHSVMIERVMHAPLRFFHTNPTGRILNRFAKDIGMQDEELPDVAVDYVKVKHTHA